MKFYTTGKGTYKRGEVGAIVETDEATGRVLMERGYLTLTNPIQPKPQEPAIDIVEDNFESDGLEEYIQLISHEQEFEVLPVSVVKAKQRKERAKQKAIEKAKEMKEKKALEAESGIKPEPDVERTKRTKLKKVRKPKSVIF